MQLSSFGIVAAAIAATTFSRLLYLSVTVDVIAAKCMSAFVYEKLHGVQDNLWILTFVDTFKHCPRQKVDTAAENWSNLFVSHSGLN